MIRFFCYFLIYSILSALVANNSFGQLRYYKPERINETSRISNIAYKLPYRGENYKFYGTLKFHISGKAFVNNKVYNSFTEAQHLTEKYIPGFYIRLLRASGKKQGRLNPYKSEICGNRLVYMCPMKKQDRRIKYYWRTGLFRFFYHFNSSGISGNNKLSVDFETLAHYLLILDEAAGFYGLRIKSVTIKRRFIKALYQTPSGNALQNRDIRFVKYLSRKKNRRYEELFLVEFEALL